MKRLNTLLTIHDDSQHSKAHRKIIQCPSCGAKYGVSGHIVDYVCPKCKTLKEFNVKKCIYMDIRYRIGTQLLEKKI